jgi:hypothetical protein
MAAVVAVAEEKHPPTFPSEIVTALQPNIPAGWTVRTDARSVVITRDEQITLLNPISLPMHDSKEEILREFGQKTDYLVVLVFKERMTDEQYAELQVKRDNAIKKIGDNEKINGKAKWGMMIREKNRHPLPAYFNSRFSIYLHRTDPPPLEVYPKSAADERAKIFHSVSKLMKKYEDHNK